MADLQHFLDFAEGVPSSEQTWKELDTTLRHYIRKRIYEYNIPAWMDQEQELLNDTVQETFLRALTYLRKVEQGIVPPIVCFEALCKVIARNYILDVQRKDRHLIHATGQEHTLQVLLELDSPIEIVLENLSRVSSLVMFSQIIVSFPTKQKTALLIDLASCTDFNEEEISFLEQAMREVGYVSKTTNTNYRMIQWYVGSIILF